MIETTNKNKAIDIDKIISALLAQRYQKNGSFPLEENQVIGLCCLTKEIIKSQAMLLQLESPLNVVGDIHGQFKDLCSLFNIFGNPQKKNYLFLGDYVDRGKQSLQCICLLMAYKIKYPDNFFMLRGNHECDDLNKIYGFYDQCKRKMNIRVWKLISDTFDYYPVAAVISNRIFCVHGGLSPQMKSLQILNLFKRPIKVREKPCVTDLLWSDPKSTLEGWAKNKERGISFYFGKNVIDLFLRKHDLDLICRSHQVVEEGYEFMHERKLVTIFSAPNYCGQFINKGAVLKINKDLKCSIEQFQGQKIKTFKLTRQRSVTPIAQLRIPKQCHSQDNQRSKSPSQIKIRRLTRTTQQNSYDKQQDINEINKEWSKNQVDTDE